MRTKSNPWKYSWIGLLLFFACGRGAIYQSRVPLSNSQWPVETVLDFSFPIKDTTQAYDICLLVKNTQDYPYQNLYVTHYLEDDTGQLLHKELKNYPIFDLKTGKSLGKGLGKAKSQTCLVIDSHQFSHPGTYVLKIEHFMRMEILPGLQTIGIKVFPSKQISE